MTFDTSNLAADEKNLFDGAIDRLKATPEGKFIFDFLDFSSSSFVVRMNVSDAPTGYLVIDSNQDGIIDSSVLHFSLPSIANGQYMDASGFAHQQVFDEVLFHEVLHLIDLEYISQVERINTQAIYDHLYGIGKTPPPNYIDTAHATTNIIRNYFGKIPREEDNSSPTPPHPDPISSPTASDFTVENGRIYAPLETDLSSEPITSIYFIESFVLPLLGGDFLTPESEALIKETILNSLTLSEPLPSVDLDGFNLQYEGNFGRGTDNVDLMQMGGTGNHLFLGFGGADVITSGSGNDWIDGGQGNDFITGGSGGDAFIYRPGDGNDVITDFSLADGDHIFFLQKIPSVPITADDLTTARLGADLIITITSGAGGSITLKNYFLDFENASAFGGVRIDFESDNSSKVFITDPITGEILHIADDFIFGTSVSETFIHTDTLISPAIFAFGGDDIIIDTTGIGKFMAGNADNDTFEVTVGEHMIDGGSGFDTVSYTQSAHRVLVNAGTGQVRDFSGGTGNIDTLRNIEKIIGSPGDDIFVTGNVQHGMAYDGGGGYDSVHGVIPVLNEKTLEAWNETGTVKDSYVNMEEFQSSPMRLLPDLSQTYPDLLISTTINASGKKIKTGQILDFSHVTEMPFHQISTEILSNYNTTTNTFHGTNLGDELTIHGGTLYTGNGDDIVQNGFFGGAGNLHYRGGNDILNDGWGMASLNVWNGITLANVQSVTLSPDYRDVMIDFGAFGSWNLVDFHASLQGTKRISFDSGGYIQTSHNGDGTWSYTINGATDPQLIQTLTGTWGNDVIKMNITSGEQTLIGLGGDDTYVFKAGSGTGIIRDYEGVNTIRFEDGLTLDDLSLARTGDDLHITVSSGFVVEGYFVEPNTVSLIEVVGVGTFSLEETIASLGFTLSGGETTAGTENDDIFRLLGENTTVSGLGGDDIFYSNFGGHNIDGGDGFDTLNYAAYFEENLLAADVYISVENGYSESFIDGALRSDTIANVEKFITGAGNDEIYGSTNDEIFITGDGDDYVVGGGFGDGDDVIDGGNNLFIDGTGSDHYRGTRGGTDTVSYAELDTEEGVNVFLGNFGTGDRQIYVYNPDDPEADPDIIIETDTLEYIDNVIGTALNDTFSGGFDGDHVFDGGGGSNFYNIAMGGGFHHTIIDGNSSSRLFLISSSLFDDRVEDLRITQDGNDMLVSNIVSGTSIRLIDFMITPTVGQLRLREDGQSITITTQELLAALDTGGIIGGEPPVENTAPIAQDDSFTGTEDAVLTGNVLTDNGNGADSDADGDTLTVTPATLTTAAGGSVVLLENGDFTYTPAADFNGADSFSYTVTDGNGGSDTATATLDIAPVNDVPVAADDLFILDEDTVLSGNLLVDNGNGADIDVDGDNLSVVAETLVTAQGGTVDILANGDFTYTPAENFNGTDSFSYTLDDGNGGTAVGNVSLTVNPVNDAPVAIDDIAVTDEDTAVIVDVLANDSDVENDTLSISAVTDGANGTVTHDGTSVTYTPDADFFGADSFTYTVSDGNGGFDTATVNVTVNPVNDNPVAADGSFTGDEDSVITGNVLADNGNGADSDVDGDALSVVAETIITAQGGTVNILANGDFTYTPAENFNGTDSFTYTVSDGNGGFDTATVDVTINSVNDAPIANDDTATTDEDAAVVVDVLANDTDVENDALSVSAVSNGASGTVTHNGTSVTYTPNTGFSGTDSFTYTVSDGNGGFDTATVNVTVEPASTGNTPPVANDDDFTVEHGNALTGNLLADNGHGADSDADNDNLTVTAAAIMTLAGATVTILANGDFTYEGATGFVGTDSFEYTLEDGNGGFDTAFASITVTAPAGAVVGTEGDDNISSGSGNDVIFLPSGNNDVSSGSGNDEIYAGSGDDQISSGSGNDNITITGGNNDVQGGSGNDAVTTGDGDDVIDGGSGNDTIISSGGDNVITGGSGDDFLQAGWGNDLLIGGSGNDWLDGGTGINTLTGGSGGDTFVFGTLNAQNTVTDFDIWDGDKLHLADLLTGYDPLAHALSDFVQASQNGNNTHISVDSDGTGAAFAMTEIAVLEGTTLDLDDLTAGGHLLIA